MKEDSIAYGLVGFPLKHSFSKAYFEDKFSKEKINATYSNFEIESIFSLDTIIRENRLLRGFNVTIPHKENILPLLSELSNDAREIKAVNVVRIIRQEDGYKLIGYNSDVIGFVDSLIPLLDKTKHKKALVLGTGGASKAVVVGLNKMGIQTQLVSRRAGENVITYSDLSKEIMRDYLLIVNCTPLGTFPNVDDCPPIPYELLTVDHLLYDLVYNPAETKYLKLGKSHGCATKNGYEMLVLQAEAAWSIWNEPKIVK